MSSCSLPHFIADVEVCNFGIRTDFNSDIAGFSGLVCRNEYTEDAVILPSFLSGVRWVRMSAYELVSQAIESAPH